MPRVVQDQKKRFNTDDFFKKLSRESEVRYLGHKELDQDERSRLLQMECRAGKELDIAILATGTCVKLSTENNIIINQQESVRPYRNSANGVYDLAKEPGKTWIQAPMILNGVCVTWRGYLDTQQLDGYGKFDFDEERAAMEEEALRISMGKSRRRVSGEGIVD